LLLRRGITNLDIDKFIAIFEPFYEHGRGASEDEHAPEVPSANDDISDQRIVQKGQTD
jgi:hypothetical protein